MRSRCVHMHAHNKLKCTKKKKEGKGLVHVVLGTICACHHACVLYNSNWRGEGPEMTKHKVALEKKTYRI